jgi:sphingosine kinase
VFPDEESAQKQQFNCCGVFPIPLSRHPRPAYTTTKLTAVQADRIQVILYHYILWAELSESSLIIRYADRASKTRLSPTLLTFSLTGSTNRKEVELWVSALLDRSYHNAKKRKRIKVLINPFGGQGKAQKYFTRDIEPIFAAAKCELSTVTTQRQGHASEIAEELDVSKWDVVACCSGDGLPYEVFNGLASKPDAKHALSSLAVVQLPCGTGNAMSLNMNGTDSPSMAALAVVKGLRTSLDLVSITQGDSRKLSFLSQSIGIVAESDLGTENLRWMGGARFTYGFLVRLLGKTVWPCDVAVGVEIDDKSAIKDEYRKLSVQDSTTSKIVSSSSSEADGTKDEGTGLPPLRYGTINDPLPSSWTLTPYPNLGNFYSGNMAYMAADTPMFPAALPSDGCLDLVTIPGDIPLKSSLSLLDSVGKGHIFEQKYVRYRKVSGYRIIPKEKEGYVSIDGERFPFEAFQAEVHRGLGCTLSRSGKLYEAKGPA